MSNAKAYSGYCLVHNIIRGNKVLNVVFSLLISSRNLAESLCQMSPSFAIATNAEVSINKEQ